MSAKLSYAQSVDESLPDGWRWSTLGEVADVLAGNPAPQGEEFFSDGKYPFVRVQDMGRLSGATRISATNDYINDKAVKRLRLFPKGSVLFTKSGASTLLNQRAMLGSDMYVVSHIAAAIPKDDILSEWLYYWLRTVDFAQLAHATTLPSLPLSKAKGIPVPVAPLDQQKRIVAEIEKQFSRLDEAVANLKRVKANLKRYKAAVLKAAVEGRLVETEAERARREGRSYETGAQLLQRILETRRSQWLASAEQAGRKGKGKYKEPAAPDTTDLPELPEGWVWTSLGSLGNVIGGLTKNPKRATLKKKLPYLRVANVYANELRLEEIEEIGIDDSELEKLLVHKGDLLIVEGNGSPDQIGRLAIWDGSISPCVHQNHLIKVRLHQECAPEWGMSWLLSPDGRNQVRDAASSTSGLYTLSVGKVSDLLVPLPPINEQHRIVAEVDRRLSLLRETEAQVDANLQRAERLRQTILSKAFTHAPWVLGESYAA